MNEHPIDMNEHPIEVRQAVLAELHAGEMGIMALAKKHGVHRTTIRRWRDEAGLPNTSMAHREKRIDLGEAVLSYVTETLRTLAAQARFFRDEDWLKQQGAGTIYLVHGVLADKAIRILASIERSEPEERAELPMGDS